MYVYTDGIAVWGLFSLLNIVLCYCSRRVILEMAQPKSTPGLHRNKLRALQYHSADVNIVNPHDLKALVVWLEDQKIRFYKITERSELRDNTGDNWTTTFQKYLNDLECPHNPETSLQATVDWLLGVALRYEYNDLAQQQPQLKGFTTESSKASPHGTSKTSSSATNTTSSLESITASEDIFQKGVEALAKILKVTKHPDPTVALAACRIVIEEKLSDKAIEKAKEAASKGSKSSPVSKKHFVITPKDCGFDIGDPVLAEAAKVLRLLHIQELRFLQTRINELIVAVQSITADPKTNQKLGKVGR